MSAVRLRHDATECTKYSIIGTHVGKGGGTFVKHVAILKKASALSNLQTVDVWQVGPPIVAGPLSSSQRFASQTCVASVVGDMKLGVRQCEAVANFLSQVDKQYRLITPLPFQQYQIIPHSTWVRAPETNRKIRRRFSCSGFVAEAYAEAGVVLVDLENLPAAKQVEIQFAFPDLQRISSGSEKLKQRYGFVSKEDLGLVGDGPWPVLLPGYLFHACDRSVSEDDYDSFVVPSSDFAYFPLRQPAAPSPS